MTKEEIRDFFIDKDLPSPITDRLIAAGYRQKSGGYIAYAASQGIKDPSQYWHLIYEWCALTKENAPFNRSIQCGELIFWMAEVSGAVDAQTLNQLADEIIEYYLQDRRRGNRVIQAVCFDKILQVVKGDKML